MIQEMDASVSCDAALSSPTSSPRSNSNEKEPSFDRTGTGTQSLKELVNFYPKKDLIHSAASKENAQIKPTKTYLTASKSTRKAESFSSDESQLSSDWICKNLSCKAVCKPDDSFCRRCSCCICRKFDENKDPSLWLVCHSDSTEIDSCNLSCHVECALHNSKAGSVQLDGCFCCPSCGNVSSILGCLKRQLETAKEARRLETLCYRINLSYRLLNGANRFEELNEIIQDVKLKLENEVGPTDSVSASSARSLVSRLSVSTEVQRLCSLAIKKAAQIMGSDSVSNIKQKELTKSLEIIKKKANKKNGAKKQGNIQVLRSSGFKVRDLGKVLRQTSPRENPSSEKTLITAETEQETEEDSCEEVPKLDLNLTLNLGTSSPKPNPNPNADMAVPLEESHTESRQNKSTLLLRSNSKPRVDFPNPLGHLEENFEYCVRVIRWLECEGYFGKEFRMKFLTWFSLRSSDKERRVVITFIRTLIDEPSCLAAQLLDSFEEIVNCKKQRHGFCTKLWH